MKSGRILRFFAVALVIISIVPDACAEPLGRLFFTPGQRAMLDRQRQSGVLENYLDILEAGTLKLGGLVKRSDGKTTVWVNGVALHDIPSSSGIKVRLAPRGQALLGVGSEPAIRLRVGETFDRASGETKDGLSGGRVRSEAIEVLNMRDKRPIVRHSRESAPKEVPLGCGNP